ncbi:hypothetical protein [Tropicimonas isoalkanivorans]|uniref:Uncharacterized protein n=1 Tax=Tropicimonas isoalkanivorans TaxID=441112 RepID=A0A1I1IKK3_9RHOB|nr:hypothetical protein [Tropicimonas isoalkanivorans]SFC36491.1 hypothetical protein SAMN04488094_104121 [Tropicimonas isoalkanivorans]
MPSKTSSRETVAAGELTGRCGKVLFRGAGVLALGLGLAACDESYATKDQVYLPASTPRLSAPAQRALQLSTGTHADDIPAYTGAPGPHGEHPAYVPATGRLVFRDDFTTTTPGEATATVREVRAATADTTHSSVSEVEIEQAGSGREYLVLKNGS